MAVKDSESRMVLMKKINGCSVLKSIVNKKNNMGNICQ